MVHAQDRYMTKEGEVSFFSSAPLEDIEAFNKEAQSVIDIEKKQIAISIPIRGFKFERSLMEEHFNENYLESEKYPKATFKGTYACDDCQASGVYKVKVNGEMTIHGVTKPFTMDGTLTIGKSSVRTQTTFKVRLEDFDIEIPRMVFKNIAEVVDVKADFTHKPLNK